MNNINLTTHLKEVHAKRKENTQKKVDEAIKRLIKVNEKINFNSVASESGLTKATLYNHENIRSRIESLREQQAQVPTPKQIKREMDDNSKDAIIASLKRKCKRFEEENKQLKEQLKVAYGDVYKNYK